MRWSVLSVLLLLLGLGRVAAQTNLLSNPGFETAPAQNSGDITGQGWYTQSIGWSGSSSQTFTVNNWTFGKTANFTTSGEPTRLHWFRTNDRPGWAPAPRSGNFAVQLNTDHLQTQVYIEQSLTLAPGGYYFGAYFTWETVNLSDSLTGVVLEVRQGSTVLASQTFTAGPTSTQPPVWNLAAMHYQVTTAGTYTFRILDYVPLTGKARQQNVIIDDAFVVVPEPSVWAALAVLGVMCGVMEWRRRVQGRGGMDEAGKACRVC